MLTLILIKFIRRAGKKTCMLENYYIFSAVIALMLYI